MQNYYLNIISIVLYLSATTILAWRLFHDPNERGAKLRHLRWMLLGVVLAALSIHGAALYSAMFTGQGLNMGVFNALSLITWIAVFTTTLAAFLNPVENLGIILLPLAALAILLETLIPVEHTILPKELGDLKVHILLSLTAYSLLFIAALHALLLAAQDKHLRTRRPGGFVSALPPLQTMETLLFQMIALGFFLHSLSMVTGLIHVQDMLKQRIAHHTVLSIIAWFIFAVLLWGRWRFGWRGNTAVRWTLGGFIALLLAYIGSKWVLEIILAK